MVSFVRRILSTGFVILTDIDALKTSLALRASTDSGVTVGTNTDSGVGVGASVESGVGTSVESGVTVVTQDGVEVSTFIPCGEVKCSTKFGKCVKNHKCECNENYGGLDCTIFFGETTIKVEDDEEVSTTSASSSSNGEDSLEHSLGVSSEEYDDGEDAYESDEIGSDSKGTVTTKTSYDAADETGRSEEEVKQIKAAIQGEKTTQKHEKSASKSTPKQGLGIHEMAEVIVVNSNVVAESATKQNTQQAAQVSRKDTTNSTSVNGSMVAPASAGPSNQTLTAVDKSNTAVGKNVRLNTHMTASKAAVEAHADAKKIAAQVHKQMKFNRLPCSGHGDLTPLEVSLHRKDWLLSNPSVADTHGIVFLDKTEAESKATKADSKATTKATLLQTFSAAKEGVSMATKDTVDSQVAHSCQCHEGWVGTVCDTPRCEADCNLSGVCLGGKCVCGSKNFGEICEFARCENDCMGQGYCFAGQCVCNSGFEGTDCSVVSTAGVVVDVPLYLFGPRKTVKEKNVIKMISTLQKMKDESCPNDCSHRGSCAPNGRCECLPGYSGVSCEVSCPNECTRNGHCVEGACLCYAGWGGVDCSVGSCCNGHGTCDEPGVCKCDAGWGGDNCETRVMCPHPTCNDNGVCQSDGTCLCNPGFAGETCTGALGGCNPACGPNGSCNNGMCVCKVGWIGPTCDTNTKATDCEALDHCNHRGLCIGGNCMCSQGWQGNKCELEFKAPGAGEEEASTGEGGGSGDSGGPSNKIVGLGGPPALAKQVCGPEGKCSNQGVCDTVKGECVCEEGFAGEICEFEKCPSTDPEIDCSGNGLCTLDTGKCECANGWTGDDCATKTCKFDCGDHGLCDAAAGKCECEVGWQGENCKEAQCKNDCSGNGECIFSSPHSPGECSCKLGWMGDDCSQGSILSTFRKCANNCSGNGLCMDGKCACNVGWEGVDCHVKICENPNMQGPNCDIPKCPNDCSGKGVCLNGKCSCWSGFLGVDCNIPAVCFEPCEPHCTADPSSERCNFCVGQCNTLVRSQDLGRHNMFDDLKNSLIQTMKSYNSQSNSQQSTLSSKNTVKKDSILKRGRIHKEVYKEAVFA